MKKRKNTSPQKKGEKSVKGLGRLENAKGGRQFEGLRLIARARNCREGCQGNDPKTRELRGEGRRGRVTVKEKKPLDRSGERRDPNLVKSHLWGRGAGTSIFPCKRPMIGQLKKKTSISSKVNEGKRGPHGGEGKKSDLETIKPMGGRREGGKKKGSKHNRVPPQKRQSGRLIPERGTGAEYR